MGILVLKRVIALSLDIFSISSEKEYLINLNIIKSPTKAPKPAINPASKIFCSLANISNITVAGAAVKPYVKRMPAKNVPKYPKLNKKL